MSAASFPDVAGRPTVEGNRIRLLAMHDDPDPIPAGATGTVTLVNPSVYGLDQVGVSWDAPHAQRSLMLLPRVDTWEVLA